MAAARTTNRVVVMHINQKMMLVALFLLLPAAVLTMGQVTPLPTPSQLKYQQGEIVALTHFNMATFFRDGDPACDSSNWQASQKPASFAPTNLNVSNWLQSYLAVGVTSAILTAKHGCGFLLWPTNVTLPNGENYGYHTFGPGGIQVDVVAEFTKTMQAAGLPHSFYYSLKDSFFLNAISDNVLPSTNLLPGQINVTQDQFEDISVAAVTELWSKYGTLNEIWFDGGISDRIKPRIVALLQALQPDAITFGAGIDNDVNEVDWVGTESGSPTYPVWSTGCNAPGDGSTGDPNSTQFCPKGSDVTLQSPDVWFFQPGNPIKSLAELIVIYHATVGANSVMELDFAVDRTGNIDPGHADRYQQFGNWIRACYGSPVAHVAFQNTSVLVLSLPPNAPAVDRVIVQEDLQYGQRIRAFEIDVQVAGGAWVSFAAGSAVGHKHVALGPKVFANVVAVRLTVTAVVNGPAAVSLAAFVPCPSA